MTKYTIIDIDLNINVDEIISEGALRITEKASKMLQDAISDAKILQEVSEAKERQEKAKDDHNDELYEMFIKNNNRLSKSDLSALIPNKFKTFSTMIMRFGNYLRKKQSFEYLRKEEVGKDVFYNLEKMPEEDDTN